MPSRTIASWSSRRDANEMPGVAQAPGFTVTRTSTPSTIAITAGPMTGTARPSRVAAAARTIASPSPEAAVKRGTRAGREPSRMCLAPDSTRSILPARAD